MHFYRSFLLLFVVAAPLALLAPPKKSLLGRFLSRSRETPAHPKAGEGYAAKSKESEDESTDTTANLDDQKSPRKTRQSSDIAFTRKTPQRGKHLESEGEISTDNPAAEQPSGRPRAATNPKKTTTTPSKSFLDSLKFWKKKTPATAPLARSFEAQRKPTPDVNPVMQAPKVAKDSKSGLDMYKVINPYRQATKATRLK